MWWLIAGFALAVAGLSAIIARRGGSMEGFDHHDKGVQFKRQVLERTRLRRAKKD